MRDHNVHKYKGPITGFFHQLLQIDLIRYLVARLRYIYLVQIRGKLRTYDLESGHVSSNTVSHNLKGLSDFAVVRSLALIKPLTVIESLSKDADILTIGPRSEGEILNLIGYGFMPGKIRGLDLISYSPWVDLGDMHHMPYEDSSFDAVLLGWVIAYSESPEVAAREVVRVCRPGGIVAVGVEYGGAEGAAQKAQLDYTPGAGRVTRHTEELLAFFDGHVDHVYFAHHILDDRKDLKGSVLVLFSIRK